MDAGSSNGNGESSKILGVEERIGTLTEGKDAGFNSGERTAGIGYRCKVLCTMINGRLYIRAHVKEDRE